MFRGKKVIVTGGAGFIGTHITNALIQEGADIHVLDDLSSGKEDNVDKRATFHRKDIRHLEAITPIFTDAHYVFHLAALSRVQYSIENPSETFEINTLGTHHVLEASRIAGVRRVIFSASSAVYGDQEKMPLVETMPVQPKSPYGLHKYKGELLCRLYSEVYELSTVSLRYFNVYGPGIDPNDSCPLVIALFLKQRSEGKPLTLTGDGLQTRDFVHVRDVVNANFLAAAGDKVGKGEVINIGSGRSISMTELAGLIGGEVVHVPPRLEPKHTLADNTLARELLGWSPTVPFEEGIAELKKIWNIA